MKGGGSKVGCLDLRSLLACRRPKEEVKLARHAGGFGDSLRLLASPAPRLGWCCGASCFVLVHGGASLLQRQFAEGPFTWVGRHPARRGLHGAAAPALKLAGLCALAAGSSARLAGGCGCQPSHSSGRLATLRRRGGGGGVLRLRARRRCPLPPGRAGCRRGCARPRGWCGAGGGGAEGRSPWLGSLDGPRPGRESESSGTPAAVRLHERSPKGVVHTVHPLHSCIVRLTRLTESCCRSSAARANLRCHKTHCNQHKCACKRYPECC